MKYDLLEDFGTEPFSDIHWLPNYPHGLEYLQKYLKTSLNGEPNTKDEIFLINKLQKIFSGPNYKSIFNNEQFHQLLIKLCSLKSRFPGLNPKGIASRALIAPNQNQSIQRLSNFIQGTRQQDWIRLDPTLGWFCYKKLVEYTPTRLVSSWSNTDALQNPYYKGNNHVYMADMVALVECNLKNASNNDFIFTPNLLYLLGSGSTNEREILGIGSAYTCKLYMLEYKIAELNPNWKFRGDE